MPLYEYRCSSCGKKFTLLIGMTAQADDDACPHCRSKEISRLVSRFAKVRNEDARIDEIADRLEVMGEPDSPSQMQAMVREMGKAMDDDFSEEMDQMFEEDMAGESSDD